MLIECVCVHVDLWAKAHTKLCWRLSILCSPSSDTVGGCLVLNKRLTITLRHEWFSSYKNRLDTRTGACSIYSRDSIFTPIFHVCVMWIDASASTSRRRRKHQQQLPVWINFIIFATGILRMLIQRQQAMARKLEESAVNHLHCTSVFSWALPSKYYNHVSVYSWQTKSALCCAVCLLPWMES